MCNDLLPNDDDLSMKKIHLKFENIPHDASKHIWNVETSWNARLKFTHIINESIQRFDNILDERNNIILGE